MTQENQITAINLWNANMHPLTCSKDSSILKPLCLDGKVILRCSQCGLIQENIPEVIFNYWNDKNANV